MATAVPRIGHACAEILMPIPEYQCGHGTQSESLIGPEVAARSIDCPLLGRNNAEKLLPHFATVEYLSANCSG